MSEKYYTLESHPCRNTPTRTLRSRHLNGMENSQSSFRLLAAPFWLSLALVAGLGCSSAQGPSLDPSGRAAGLDPRIQSAGPLRAGTVDPIRPASAKAEVNRIRRHFEAVLALLEDQRDASLEIALDRLERSRPGKWSAAERERWRAQLTSNRARQRAVLEAYQAGGRFPINTVSSELTPIFVDERDTACAVGHLMRESGWGEEVEAIRRANNWVYIDDVASGALSDWVLVSGLTQEEAALIQPTYNPPLPEIYLDELLATGGTIETGPLRYSNFSFEATLVGPQGDRSPAPLTLVDPADFSIASSFGLFIGADEATGIGGLATTPGDFGQDGGELRITLSYDVESFLAGRGFSHATIRTSGQVGFGIFIGDVNTSPTEDLAIDLRVFDDDQLIASARADRYDGIVLQGSGTQPFAPRRRVRVETEATITGPASFTYFVNQLTTAILPEPAVIWLLAASFLGVALRRYH